MVVGIYAVVVTIMILVLWLVLTIAFGNSSSKGKRRWKSTDGTVIEESKGMCGESYYEDKVGNSYHKVEGSEDTFIRK